MTDDFESTDEKNKNKTTSNEKERSPGDEEVFVEPASSPDSPSSEVATALNLSRVDVDINDVTIEDGQKLKEEKLLKEKSDKQKEKEMTDTSSRLPKVDLNKVTIESGTKPSSQVKEGSKKKKGKSKKRVAKTMVETEMPSIDAIKNKIEKESVSDGEKGKSKKRVAKTMVEMDLSSINAVKDKIENDSPPDKSKKDSARKPVAKTLLENEIPSVSAKDNEAERNDKGEKGERPVAKTMLESDLPDPEKLKEAIELAAREGQIDASTENVAKTMLESDFPDLLRIHSLIENKESALEKKKQDRVQDNKENTGLNVSESADSDQLKQKIESSNSQKLSKIQQAMSSGSLNAIPNLKKETLNFLDKGILRSLSDVNKPILNDGISVPDSSSNQDGVSAIGIETDSPNTESVESDLESQPLEDTLIEGEKNEDDGHGMAGTLQEPAPEPESEGVVEQVDSTDVTIEVDSFKPDDQLLSSDSESQSEEEEKELSPAELFKKQLEELDVKAPRQEDFVARTMLDHELIIDTLSDSLARMEEKAKKDIAEKELEPPVEKEYITDFKLAKECPWVWDEADSKDRLRYCGKCDNVVYDFKDLEKFQADSMVFQRENIEKYTLYKRPDDKFMTSDCPLAVKSNKNKTLMIVAGICVIVLVMTSCISAFMNGSKTAPSTKSAQDAKSSDSSATGSQGSTTTTTTNTNSNSNSMPKIKKGADGSYHYDIDDPSTYTYNDDGTTNNSSKKEKDYSNVPEADEKGGFWKYDGK